MTGHRRAEGETRLREHAVAAGHRNIFIAGQILAKTRVSYVIPSFGRETVYSAGAASNATTGDYRGAKNGTRRPRKGQALLQESGEADG